jgi:hypothetical protein
MTPMQALLRTLIDRRSESERKAMAALVEQMRRDRNGDETDGDAA